MQGTLETLVQPLSQEDPLEEDRATHSSILAWSSLWGSNLERTGRMDTCICMAESLCCPPETNTTSRSKSLQSCPTLGNHTDCSPPGSSVHRVLQFMGVCFFSFPSAPLQVELHVHLDGAIKPETILYYGR